MRSIESDFDEDGDFDRIRKWGEGGGDTGGVEGWGEKV